MVLWKFYFGTLADLQEIEPPDKFTRPSSRVQSIFQSATGRQTANVTGIRRAWSMEWDHAYETMRDWVESYQYGYQAGAVRFLDPYSKNWLPPFFSAAGSAWGSAVVFDTFTGVQTLVAPSDALPGVSQPRYVTSLVTGASGSYAEGLTRACRVPSTLGTVTFSALVKSSMAGAQLQVRAFAGDTTTAQIGASVTATVAGTGWQWLTCVCAPIAGATCWAPRLLVPASATMLVGPQQAELGSARTAWVRGGGAECIIGDLSDEVDLFPYSGLGLSLLEV